ncbi:Protein InaA [Methylophilaceae bacterium]|nr:Protein InaA [Methylophilaceae bacterium]
MGKGLLDANQLGDFDRLWDYRSEWFETPNDDRNGWSGVNRLLLALPDGEQLGFFLKRQQNYVRRTFFHPFTGESTFACEFRTISYLLNRGVPVPRPVFFDEKSSSEGLKAILVTEELVGYRPLDAVLDAWFTQPGSPIKAKRALIGSVAQAVKKLHYARIQHRALYPKHLFVNVTRPESPDVVIIDLEKARIKLMPIMRTLQDLSTLNRRMDGLSKVNRLYFFKQYYGVARLGFWTKLVCKLILWRSRKCTKVPHASAFEPTK